MNLTMNVYKATFELVRREPGTDEWGPTDVEPTSALIGAASFGSACSLAEEAAADVTARRNNGHLVQTRVRDVVLLHAGVVLRHEEKT